MGIALYTREQLPAVLGMVVVSAIAITITTVTAGRTLAAAIPVAASQHRKSNFLASFIYGILRWPRARGTHK